MNERDFDEEAGPAGEGAGDGDDGLTLGEEGENGQANGIVHSGQANGFAEGSNNRQANAERFTTPFMTKYEKARILGTRALQIRLV